MNYIGFLRVKGRHSHVNQGYLMKGELLKKKRKRKIMSLNKEYNCETFLAKQTETFTVLNFMTQRVKKTQDLTESSVEQLWQQQLIPSMDMGLTEFSDKALLKRRLTQKIIVVTALGSISNSDTWTQRRKTFESCQ